VTELHKSIYDIAPSVASAIARRFRGYVERDDVLQECLAWALTRGTQFNDALSEPNPVQRVINEKRIAWQMKRAAERYARKEKAAKSGYRTGDEAFYDTAMIAQVLPHVIASIVDDTVLEQAQNLINDGSPKKPSVPAEGGNLLATLIDVKRSYLKLEVEDQTVLRMRYHEGLTLQQVAGLLECAVSTADRRCTSALRKVQNGLGGDNPWQ
jgi:RNA polymerase sigma factor (sigma-70 family)